MLIDWFTVAAQVVNFLVLVWLLRRFLYGPILQAIDAREQRIAARLADAASKDAEASRERDAFRQRNEAFDRRRETDLARLREEVAAERQRLLDEARSAAAGLALKRQEGLRAEALALNDEIARRTRQEVLAISRKALAALAGTSLESCMAERFVDRLHRLDPATRATLAGAIRGANGNDACLRSAFELPAEARAAIQAALRETLAADLQLRFETAPALIAGIEFSVDGQKLCWSIADYLDSLAAAITGLLAVPDAAGAGAAQA